MVTVPLTKRELRQRSHQLNQLMAAWDPIGIMGHPDAPRDEYECLVGPLLTLLQSARRSGRLPTTFMQRLSSTLALPPSTTISSLWRSASAAGSIKRGEASIRQKLFP
jgi:hypothetical protein